MTGYCKIDPLGHELMVRGPSCAVAYPQVRGWLAIIESRTGEGDEGIVATLKAKSKYEQLNTAIEVLKVGGPALAPPDTRRAGGACADILV